MLGSIFAVVTAGQIIYWGITTSRSLTSGTTLIPGWSQDGTRLVPGWHQVGIRLAPGWHQVGTRLAPGWYQAYASLAPIWHHWQIPLGTSGTRLVSGWNPGQHKYQAGQAPRHNGLLVRYTCIQVNSYRYTGIRVYRYTGIHIYRYTGIQVYRYRV